MRILFILQQRSLPPYLIHYTFRQISIRFLLPLLSHELRLCRQIHIINWLCMPDGSQLPYRFDTGPTFNQSKVGGRFASCFRLIEGNIVTRTFGISSEETTRTWVLLRLAKCEIGLHRCWIFNTNIVLGHVKCLSVARYFQIWAFESLGRELGYPGRVQGLLVFGQLCGEFDF